MSDMKRPGQQLLSEFHDFEGRYDMAKGQLSTDEVFALWSALWQFSENVIVDHGQLKADERKRQRAR